MVVVSVCIVTYLICLRGFVASGSFSMQLSDALRHLLVPFHFVLGHSPACGRPECCPGLREARSSSVTTADIQQVETLGGERECGMQLYFFL